MSDLDLDELMSTFVDEAAEDIAALEAGLLVLETSPGDAEVKRELLRRTHTIKGNASCVGLNDVTTFAHAYEELLERIDDGADHALITLLLSGLDTFRRMILEDRRPHLSGRAGVPVLQHTIRVAAEKLDRMLDLAGEIAIARGAIQQLLAARDGIESLTQVEQQIDALQGELQELIMRARMVPIAPLFRQYARVIRDAAASHEKSARLVTIGDDVEIDTTAVEMLRDPLTHMIRNAVDHGIESPAQRVAAGKPAAGTITLEARHEAGSIIIRVSDDGRGLDRRAIEKKARALGLDGAGNEVIFESGFSTAAEVTDLSGRGVGMDVVRRGVEALRGNIAIETREGQGTVFSIRLPLTLAVIEGFGVTAAGESYIVPMDHVLECIQLPPGTRRGADSGVLLLRDEIVPYIRLRSLFGLDAHAGNERENVLVVQHDGAKAGLVVDELHGSGQAVVKPLGNYFNDVPGIAGSSTRGDGRVALILDTPSILRAVSWN
jgi:two-component system chemotaxis sensor kinase CheA